MLNENGSEAPQASERELPSEDGSTSRQISSRILEALGSRRGRYRMRLVLGPPLPGIEERDIDDDSFIW